MHKVETLIQKNDSLLLGIRVYNKSGKVIFTTGNNIERDNRRTGTYGEELVSFELAAGERIIGIRSHDAGFGYSNHFNAQFVIGREEWVAIL